MVVLDREKESGSVNREYMVVLESLTVARDYELTHTRRERERERERGREREMGDCGGRRSVCGSGNSCRVTKQVEPKCIYTF